MIRLRIIDAGILDPGREKALLESSLERMEPRAEPVLWVSSSPGAAISLGRYQDASRALRLDECRREGASIHRRLTGGISMPIGEGVLSLSMILPEPSAFSDRIVLEKVINRYVRGILTAIQLLGADAVYTGSDFIAINRRRVGYCTMDADGRGAVLFQTFLIVRPTALLPGSWNAYPAGGGRGFIAGEPIDLSSACGRPVTQEEILPALARGYRKRFGVDAEVRRADARDIAGSSSESVRDAETAGWGISSLREFPLGFFDARVRLGRDGKISDAILRGDFIANHPAVRRLEGSFSGKPLRRDALEESAAPVFSDPNNVFLGLRSPSPILDAVLEAGEGGHLQTRRAPGGI